MLTGLVVVFIFVNFSFALFTPPLGDYQPCTYMDTSSPIPTYAISLCIPNTTLYPKSNAEHATISTWDAIVPRLGAPQTSVFDRLAPPVQDRLSAPQSGHQAQV
jgi:hypothetical protein